jgi:phenylacetate-coenzyme A ligase PaaK-like adenylate-forming protein
MKLSLKYFEKVGVYIMKAKYSVPIVNYNVGDLVEIVAKTKKGNGTIKTERVTGPISEYKKDGWIVVEGQTFWIHADLRDWTATVIRKATA